MTLFYSESTKIICTDIMSGTSVTRKERDHRRKSKKKKKVCNANKHIYFDENDDNDDNDDDSHENLLTTAPNHQEMTSSFKAHVDMVDDYCETVSGDEDKLKETDKLFHDEEQGIFTNSDPIVNASNTCTINNAVVAKRKRRRRKGKKLDQAVEIDLPSWVVEDEEMIKYWLQRYRLFSLWDNGILLDRGKMNYYLK